MFMPNGNFKRMICLTATSEAHLVCYKSGYFWPSTKRHNTVLKDESKKKSQKSGLLYCRQIALRSLSYPHTEEIRKP